MTYLLAWIPENLLTEKGQEEWDKFLKTEERPDEDEGIPPIIASVDVLDPDDEYHRWCVDRHANVEARVIRVLCSIDLNLLPDSPAAFIIFLV